MKHSNICQGTCKLLAQGSSVSSDCGNLCETGHSMVEAIYKVKSTRTKNEGSDVQYDSKILRSCKVFKVHVGPLKELCLF